MPTHEQDKHLTLSSCDLHTHGVVELMVSARGCHPNWRHGAQRSNLELGLAEI